MLIELLHIWLYFDFVKVFVSGRDDIDILQNFERSPFTLVGIMDNSSNIKRFAQTEVARSIRDRRILNGEVSTKLEEHVTVSLVNGAQALFNSVGLQIENLCDLERIKLEINTCEKSRRLRESFAVYEASSYIALLIIKMLVAKKIWGIIMFLCLANRRSDNTQHTITSL